MRLSELRPALLAWLGQQLDIDSYWLDRPEVVGDPAGYLAPLRDFSIRREGLEVPIVNTTVDFHVLARLPDQPYKDLGLESYEGLYGTLAYRLVTRWQEIHPDIRVLDIVDVSDPLRISESGDKAGEWVLEYHWTFNIEFPLDPDTQRDDPVTNRLNVALYRAALADFDQASKDLDLTITYEH